MQPLPASPEIAEGPQWAWTEAIGGAAHPLLQAASETLVGPDMPHAPDLAGPGRSFFKAGQAGRHPRHGRAMTHAP